MLCHHAEVALTFQCYKHRLWYLQCDWLLQFLAREQSMSMKPKEATGCHQTPHSQLSVLKAWVGLFLVKIDMLSCWLHFSNTQQCVGTIYILWIEVCLVIKKKVVTFWKTAHVRKWTAKGKPHPPITLAQKAQHLDITNRGLSGSIINYSLSSNFLPGRIA